MKRWLTILAMMGVLGAVSAAAEVVDLDAMLILASNDPAPLDRRLERVEFQLRPLFRFEYYRHMGGSSASVNLPGTTSIALGDGHHLEVRATARDGKKVRAEVRWFRGDQPLLSTGVNLQPGKPVILGGVPHDKGKLIVTLTAR
mgnify:CR=1 FL=1